MNICRIFICIWIYVHYAFRTKLFVVFFVALFDARPNFLHTNCLICSMRALLELQSWWSYLSLHPEICSLTAFQTHEGNFRTHKFSDPVVFDTPRNITINTCTTMLEHNKPKVHFIQTKRGNPNPPKSLLEDCEMPPVHLWVLGRSYKIQQVRWKTVHTTTVAWFYQSKLYGCAKKTKLLLK